ncbi:hypothetical protein SCUP234_02119 [Seiridium cupressi]
MPTLPAPVADTHGISLPSRYKIVPIDASIAPWVKALMIHGFFLRPSIWQPLLPKPKVSNALRSFNAIGGHFSHSIDSGHSYAIIDSEYEYKRPESASSGGALYWDELDPSDPDFERDGKDKMLERMDCPVVCIALSVDGFDQKPAEATRALYEFMPLVRELGNYFSRRSKESGESWDPTERGELLIRSGCVTKAGYEGQGLMTALNHFVMLEAKAKGFQAISVGVGSPSVYRNWMKAPPGCHSKILAHLDVWDIELEDDQGRTIRPYVNSEMSKQGWLIWCDLDS